MGGTDGDASKAAGFIIAYLIEKSKKWALIFQIYLPLFFHFILLFYKKNGIMKEKKLGDSVLCP